MDYQSKLYHYQYVEQRSIIYIDESGLALDAPRDHGYSLLIEHLDQNYWMPIYLAV